MPCTIVCLAAPVIIGSWPLISGFVASAVASLGFTAVSSVALSNRQQVGVAASNTVELELGSIVQEEYAGQQQFVKDGITLTVKRNTQGKLVVFAQGQESEAVLENAAKTFAGKMQQAYSYHKAMSQLRGCRFNVVSENVEEDGQIHIKLRRC